jgi:hypothetical protein
MNVRVRISRRILPIAALVPCITGTTGLLWLGYSYVDGLLDEQRAERQFARQLADGTKSAARYDGAPNRPDLPGESAGASDSAPASPFDSELVGKIEIPRVKISAIVREGVDARTLGRGVGHFPAPPA